MPFIDGEKWGSCRNDVLHDVLSLVMDPVSKAGEMAVLMTTMA